MASDGAQDFIPGLSAIVPVYNEARNLVESLERVVHQAGIDEVIVVDDGSSDGSQELIKQFAVRNPKVRTFRHPSNCGKGRAIRTALAQVRTEYVVIQDADLEYDPADIATLFAAIQKPDVDVVFGSRYLLNRRLQHGRFVFQSGVRLLNWICCLLYGLRITDEATCYKMFRTTDLNRMHLTCERFEFCPEVTAKSARLRLNILELPISYNPRTTSSGKKLRYTDAFAAIWELVKWRFKPLRQHFVTAAPSSPTVTEPQEL